jgi:hypothetical protein
MQIYFFSASASTFLQAGVSLSADLLRQAMMRPPPGTVPLQYFLVVAHAGVALSGGQFLREGGGCSAQERGGDQQSA